MSHAQRGFTLIELVMVIVILSIMAAIALPKFASALRAYWPRTIRISRLWFLMMDPTCRCRVKSA